MTDLVGLGEAGEVNGQHAERKEKSADDQSDDSDPLALCLGHPLVLLLRAAPLYAAEVRREIRPHDRL